MPYSYITRRKFLQTSSLAAAGSLYFKIPVSGQCNQAAKSKVILIRNKDVLDDLNKPRTEILAEMLNHALIRLFDTNNANDAWKKIINPEDIVGIKTNEWRYLHTPKELENLLKLGILSAGVNEQNISIKDSGLLSDHNFMNSSALINVRPLRTHHWAGVGSLIKNYIMFTDKPWEMHDDSCADLGKLWKLPKVAGKTRLNILVMLTPLFHGVGPHHFNPAYLWKYNGLIIGTDPVAVDATGVRILQEKRRQFFKEEMPLNPPAKHIFLADTRHGIGNSDPLKIELIKIGWEDEILI